MKKKAKVYHINIHFLTEVKDLDNYNVDVIVHLNGQNYVATFVTFKNFRHLIEIYKKTGEFLSGKYNYSVRDVEKNNIPAILPRITRISTNY